MKKQYLHTLSINIMNRFHADVGRGFRSQWVEDAIVERLDKKSNFVTSDVPTKELALVLRNRLHQENNWQNTPLTLLLLELIE